MKQAIDIVLVGNPNAGKTTIFNLLTGAHERTGNWTGVTVASAHGTFILEQQQYNVTDLPGIYSFAPNTEDERVARDYLIRNKPAAVVNLVDASNLERSLYLTAQLLDLRVPLVVVLNHIDVAERHGLTVDAKHLEEHLGCPVIPMVGSRGTGLAELQAAIASVATQRKLPTARVVYGDAEKSVQRLQVCLVVAADDAGVNSRWLAIQLLENDPFARENTQGLFDEIVVEEHQRIARHTARTPDSVVMDARLGFTRGLARDVTKKRIEIKRRISDIADRLLLSRPLGIPFFLGVMYLVFTITVTLAQPMVEFIDDFFSVLLIQQTRIWLEAIHSPPLVTTLLSDGLGAGLTTVASFMPPIFLVFFCLTLLEESGYMSRAAFIMDNFLNSIGLPGKAFIPLLVGFGCTVPALMATRTLEQRRTRILTMLLAPFMSCGARLPVYALFAMAFFPTNGHLIIFTLYLTGVLLAIISGVVLHRTLFRGQATAYVMELPPYHIPALRGCLEHVWHNLKSFLCNAGRIILIIAILMTLGNSLLEALSRDKAHADERRAQAGRSLTTAFRPMGMTENNWPAGIGLLTGLMAKEAVIGTLEVLYAHDVHDETAEEFSLKEEFLTASRQLLVDYRIVKADAEDSAEDAKGRSLLESLRRNFNDRAAAFAYLLFILIYSPCIAALIVLGREAGWRWMNFAIVYQTLLAWMVAVGFYQVVTFTHAPLSALSWLGVIAVTSIIAIGAMNHFGKRAWDE